MAFPIVVVRTREQSADDRYPVMASPGGSRPVVPEPDDGDVIVLRAHEIAVRSQQHGELHEIVHVRRHGAQVLVTDSRVVVAAAHQGERSILAGHVRYRWVVAVGGSRAAGHFDDDELRLITQAMDGAYLVLTIGFEGEGDIHELAREVARRAAADWVRRHPLAAEDELGLWRRVGLQRVEAAPGEFGLHWMPDHERVSAARL